MDRATTNPFISQTDGSGNQAYLLGNGQGSTEALVDGSGSIASSYRYDIFGAVRGSSGSGSTEYRFTGQQDDGTLGYTYLRARYSRPYHAENCMVYCWCGVRKSLRFQREGEDG